jgi:hypothetical protein
MREAALAVVKGTAPVFDRKVPVGSKAIIVSAYLLALGAQSGESRMRAVATEAGFSSFRRASETPFNIIYEARP